ncbi:alpha-glucan family phosphorylase [Gordonia soli]|uniref:alpha-glucan family phosphorylase n=1 Tax=Gordonia soli TaxID=320799 RepID=UPI00058F5C44|nr:alpha-glucan family phosphorylase [Gordonia soli]
MKAFRRFTVRVPLPDSLAALDALAHNLRWAWHAPTQDLFARVDPERWARDPDPLHLLAEVDGARWAELAADQGFRDELAEVRADLEKYLTQPRWFDRFADGRPTTPRIAYFSMEFGISEVLAIYSGGLGILAGDHLKAASDLGVPLIGVGLFYRSGYFRQSLTADGWQVERYPVNNATALPLTRLTDGDEPVVITIPMPDDRDLRAHVWVATVGRIPLLLLDSDLPVNDEQLRSVTDRLYGGDQDKRIKQELLLGVGGVRAIREFTRIRALPDPTVFHMNEGHAGFLGVERIRELVDGPAGLDIGSAEAVVRASTVFTTHTPVPAGIDRFPLDLVRDHLRIDSHGSSAVLPGVDPSIVLALGDEPDPAVFNMAHMGFRLAQRSNGVSRLHGEVSREMFTDLWPGFDAPEVPIGSVTNGVHAPTWTARAWLDRLGDPSDGDSPNGDSPNGDPSDTATRTADRADTESGPSTGAAGLSAGEIRRIRTELRGALVTEVRRRTRRSGLDRGFTDAELTWTAEVFHPDVLTIGFARRAATYKRLTLMLRDQDRLRRLLTDADRPIQLVIAGKAHPADDGGKSLIQQMVRFADDPAIRHRIVFLPDYDISMARAIYAGCDVWLNNPVRPLEACGTSGMKSALNGGLNLSILDGWWDEMADGDNGWAIPSAEGADEHRRDDLEAEALYTLLERTVIPGFYDPVGAAGANTADHWADMVRHTLDHLGPQVSASRMVRDYTAALYTPAAESAAAITADSYAAARDLARYRTAATTAWSAVAIAGVDDSMGGAGDGDSSAADAASPGVMGAGVRLTAHVALAGLAPSRVKVQALIGPVDDEGSLVEPTIVEMAPLPEGDPSGRTLFDTEVTPDRSGRLGYTARVLPRHPQLTDDAELGLVRYPSGSADDADG